MATAASKFSKYLFVIITLNIYQTRNSPKAFAKEPYYKFTFLYYTNSVTRNYYLDEFLDSLNSNLSNDSSHN
jgi:hypothetical protein